MPSSPATNMLICVQHKVNAPIKNETFCTCNTFQAQTLHTYLPFSTFSFQSQNAPAKLLNAPEQTLFCMSSFEVISHNHILCLQGNNYFHTSGQNPGSSTTAEETPAGSGKTYPRLSKDHQLPGQLIFSNIPSLHWRS